MASSSTSTSWSSASCSNFLVPWKWKENWNWQKETAGSSPRRGRQRNVESPTGESMLRVKGPHEMAPRNAQHKTHTTTYGDVLDGLSGQSQSEASGGRSKPKLASSAIRRAKVRSVGRSGTRQPRSEEVGEVVEQHDLSHSNAHGSALPVRARTPSSSSSSSSSSRARGVISPSNSNAFDYSFSCTTHPHQSVVKPRAHEFSPSNLWNFSHAQRSLALWFTRAGGSCSKRSEPGAGTGKGNCSSHQRQQQGSGTSAASSSPRQEKKLKITPSSPAFLPFNAKTKTKGPRRSRAKTMNKLYKASLQLLAVFQFGTLSASLFALAALEKLSENLYRAIAKDFETLFSDYPQGFFIKFQVPWSQQCQKWKPIFEQAAKDALQNVHLRDELKITVPFVEVDMTNSDNLNLASLYQLSGFPTFLYFRKPDEEGWTYSENDAVEGYLEYLGEPSAPSVIEFLESVAGAQAVQYGIPDAHHERLSLLLVNDGDRLPNFTKVASKNRKRARWHHLKVDEYAKSYAAQADHGGNPLNKVGSRGFVELRHREEPPVFLDLEKVSLSDTERQVELMMESHQFPAYGKIDRATFGQYSGAPLAWVLPDVGDEKEFEDRADDFREVMLLAATKQMATLRPGGIFTSGDSPFRIAATNTVSFRGSIQAMFGISEFPHVVAQMQPGSSEYYLYPHSVEELKAKGPAAESPADKLVEWFKNVRDGKVARSFKSEPIPDYETEPGEPKIVVAKTLEQSAFQANRDVFLNVFAPWCGHCKRFSPEFRKVARKVYLSKMDTMLFVAQMDGTANESPIDILQWTGFPTLYFIPAGSRSVQEYQGKRDADTVWQWLTGVSTFASHMDKELGEIKMDL
ncbi:unnamed protein product [Amoebophrya sp. A120]|nr:unnamed protein product [Amoebophrya sp. A120]|eukprot:GSA120T00016709001.1